jgi:uncharacterized membrane protein
MSATLKHDIGQPEIGTSRPWVGKVFLLLALAWFGGVFYIMRPDHPHAVPRPAPYITLADGKNYRVYLPSEILGAEANWVEGIDIKTEYTSWDFMRRPLIRFLIIAVAPIFAALAGAFLWLGIAEWRVRRRYAGFYSSY